MKMKFLTNFIKKGLKEEDLYQSTYSSTGKSGKRGH